MTFAIKGPLFGQPIEVKSDLSELYLHIDYNGGFYPPSLKLQRQESKKPETKFTTNAHSNLVKASDIQAEVKNRITLKYSDIAKGSYVLNITQYFKPKDCLNDVTINFRVISSKEENQILQSSYLGKNKLYLSNEEINSINRYV